MRSIGEKVLVKTWGFLCDLVEVLVIIFKIALKPAKRVPLRVRAICSAIASAITCGIIVRLFCGSFIISGIAYGSASVQKWLAIFWASEGDWYHPMTAGRYNFFKAFKEELIETDGFAQLLNSLAGKGFILKAVQLLLIALCFASMIYLFSVLFKCLRNLIFAVGKMISKAGKKQQNTEENTDTKKKTAGFKVISLRSYCTRTTKSKVNQKNNNLHVG